MGDELIRALKNRIIEVKHNDVLLYFCCPSRIANYRARTFSSKEPLTLKWIDEMSGNSILWDIGANVGLYSIYAAKARGIEVFAFEPSVFNLDILAKNIYLNDVTNLISIIPVPLYRVSGFNKIILSSENIGSALNTFAEKYGQDGKALNSALEYRILGLSADDLATIHKLNPPTHLKIDVDGIEHLILSGATNTLKTVQSVLIEVNEKFVEQLKGINFILQAEGFSLHEKHRLGDDASSQQSNQLWVRGA
jgi:FkbM family methyltransferase